MEHTREFIDKLMYRIKVLRTGIENSLVLNDINEIKKNLIQILRRCTNNLRWEMAKNKTKWKIN
jgi:hypothetical protein